MEPYRGGPTSRIRPGPWIDMWCMDQKPCKRAAISAHPTRPGTTKLGISNKQVWHEPIGRLGSLYIYISLSLSLSPQAGLDMACEGS